MIAKLHIIPRFQNGTWERIRRKTSEYTDKAERKVKEKGNEYLGKLGVGLNSATNWFLSTPLVRGIRADNALTNGDINEAILIQNGKTLGTIPYQNSPGYVYLGKANLPQCSYYVHHENPHTSGLDLLGNAWNETGSDIIANGYNIDGFEVGRPISYSFNSALKYNKDAAQNLAEHFNLDSLDKNYPYTVNMYFDPSQNLARAFKEGTNGLAGSHIGTLLWNGTDWVVLHNVHGNVSQQRAKELMGNKYNVGITQIRKPKKMKERLKVKKGTGPLKNPSVTLFLQQFTVL